jgi:type 1 fimbriae regulatory protein FimB
MRRLTEVEIENILNVAYAESRRDATMILLQFFHAMRSDEVCSLKLVDVSLETSSITIRRKKGSLTTVQALHVHRGNPRLDEVKALKAWMAERDPSSEYLFPTQKASKMDRRSYWRLFRGYALAAGIPLDAAHPHSLKHASASYLLRQGADLATVRQHCGHAAWSSTLRYLGTTDEMASATTQTLFARM